MSARYREGMAPPLRSDAGGAAPVDPEGALLDRMAEVQGVINVAHGELVALVAEAVAEGWAGGGLLSTASWVALRAGIAPSQAHGIARIAARAEELPRSVTALQEGRLTVDQVAEIARHVPAAYDESAARVASCCTVKQLRQALPHYAEPKPEGGRRERREVATGIDEHGWWIRGRLPESEGALVDRALDAAREDLDRQARSEAPEGDAPPRATTADALVALAETSLRVGEAARPGTDRYLVHVHLHAGLSGPELMTHLGVAVPDGERRLVLCNARLRATLHRGTTPVAMGRATHIVNRRLRRLIEHRDGGCAVPGCHRTTGLEVHHIVHWEDDGPTETWNLLTLCAHHHARHHDGSLGIEGDADLPRHREGGVVFCDARGRVLDPVGTPIPPSSGVSASTAARASGLPAPRFLPPTGERLDRAQFHLQRDPPDPPVHPVGGAPRDDDRGSDAAHPASPGHRSAQRPPGTDGDASHTADPTRAGPDA